MLPLSASVVQIGLLVVNVRCRTEIANNWGYMIEGKLVIHIAVAGRGISKV